MKEALTLALEALEGAEALLLSMGLTHLFVYGDAEKAITDIHETLAQPEQEPVATINDLSNSKMFTLEANGYSRKDNLYTTPPKRPWVGLTDEQIADATGIYPTTQPDKWHETLTIARNIEAKLKEKNT